MRTTSLPFIFVVLLLPLLSMGSCAYDDENDSQTTGGDATLAADIDEGSTRTTDVVDASGAPDAGQADDDDATDADEGSAIPDAVDASGAPDAGQADDDDATDASDESGATDTLEGDNDAESGDGSVGEGDLASCKKSCAADDLECTGVCGGSPLCLSQCAVAYTACNDACDAAFGG